MKTYRNYLIMILLLVIVSCNKKEPTPAQPTVELSGTFKAIKVQEGNTLVFTKGGTSNIIPGYANYRITFDGTKAKLTEYSGETFDGSWAYEEAISTLTLKDLVPRPAAGNLVFKVEKIESGSLILSSSLPNPKTGNSLNQYVLEKE